MKSVGIYLLPLDLKSLSCCKHINENGSVNVKETLKVFSEMLYDSSEHVLNISEAIPADNTLTMWPEIIPGENFVGLFDDTNAISILLNKKLAHHISSKDTENECTVKSTVITLESSKRFKLHENYKKVNKSDTVIKKTRKKYKKRSNV